MVMENEAWRRSPVFLVGAERSGTTLLRLMLDHHPEIAFHLEFEYAVQQMDDQGNEPDKKAYIQWLSHHLFFQDSGFEIDPSLDYRDLVHSFLRQKQERDGKRIVGATVHHHFNRLSFLWPDARFIHLVRDPRDVARSCIRMGWAGNVWLGVDRWIQAESIWESMKKDLDPTRYIEVKYEDLIRNPKDVLTRLCGFLSAPFDQAMFAYAASSTYDAPDPELVFQWRKKSSEEEIRLVETKVGPLLRERGYQPSGLAPIQVTESMKQALLIQDRKAGRSFRIKRYGLPLLILAKIARRLPFPRLKARIGDKINAIDRKHMR